MPLYEYIAVSDSEACEYCVVPFECLVRSAEDEPTSCPECGLAVKKVLSGFAAHDGKPGTPIGRERKSRSEGEAIKTMMDRQLRDAKKRVK